MSPLVAGRQLGGLPAASPLRQVPALSCLLLLLGCPGGAPPAAQPASVTAPGAVARLPAADARRQQVFGPAQLAAADSPRVTEGGVRYVVPAGWAFAAQGALTVLSAQEGDSHVAIVESSAAAVDAAVAQAWALYRREPPPRLLLATELAGREGWARVRRYDYELPPNEKRALGVLAQQHGSSWVVTIQDASRATIGKRGAQFRVLLESLMPAGYQRESFAGKPANRLDAKRLLELDELIELGRRELEVPGVAVAVVQAGQVIHARGYGVRQLGRPEPVAADTLFGIASNTKALTTLLLAQLVDEGKLRWDQPVTEVYPGFRLGDAATTAATRIEHLVCACTGLPRKDFEWLFEFGRATPQTGLEALARTQPTTRLGEAYQYSNLLAAVAGYVAGHVAAPGRELGASYEQAMLERIFTPLGMQKSTLDIDRARRGELAAPHALDIDARMAPVDMALNYGVVPLRPAGGAWSTARELIQYVRLELARGVAPSGQRIVSEQNLLQRRKPIVRVGEWRHYGMGLGIELRYGITSIDHGGSLFGYRSQMYWLPEHGVGLVILTNADTGSPLLRVVYRYLLELLFDGRPEAVEDLRTAARTIRESRARERERLTVPASGQVLAALAARYQHESLGELLVRRAGAAAHFDFGEWQSEVASRANDDGTSSLVTIAPGTGGFNFVAGSAGGKRTLTLREAQHEYVFVEAR